MRFVLAALPVLVTLFAPRTAHAQSFDPRLVAPAMEWRRIDADGRLSPASAARVPARVSVEGVQPEGEVSAVWLFVAGVAGGGLGMMGGAMGGALLDGDPDEDCIDFCFGPGLVLGALGGEAVGIATAVHLANGRKGSYPAGVLTSAGLLALGIVVGHEMGESLVLVPASQILGAIVVERATERRRRRR